jgi:hypothetical protein
MHILRVLLPKPTGLQNFSKRNEKNERAPAKPKLKPIRMLETGYG